MNANVDTDGFVAHADDHDVMATPRWTQAPGTWLAIPQVILHEVDRPSQSPAICLSFAGKRPAMIDLAATELGSMPLMWHGSTSVELGQPADLVSGFGVPDAERWPIGRWHGPVRVRIAGGTVHAYLGRVWRGSMDGTPSSVLPTGPRCQVA